MPEGETAMPPRSKSDPADLSDTELAAETEQAAVDAGTHVRLATVYPSDVFDTSLDGVEAITCDGTLVPVGQESDVRKLAKEYGVRIQKVSN
jgi:hypothetical protein